MNIVMEAKLAYEDHIYFSMRAEVETRRAERATCSEAAKIHRELAQAYRLRAAALSRRTA